MKIADAHIKPGFDRRPGYPMAFHPAGKHVRVTFAGATVVDSAGAMVMDEDGHQSVYYFARDEVRMDLMVRTAHSSH